MVIVCYCKYLLLAKSDFDFQHVPTADPCGEDLEKNGAANGWPQRIWRVVGGGSEGVGFLVMMCHDTYSKDCLIIFIIIFIPF